MFSIDRYAYSNRLVSVHPGEKMAFTLITMLICLASTSYPAPLAITLVMSGAVVIRAGIPWLVYLKFMSVPASFLLMGVAAVAISVSSSGVPGDYVISAHPGGIAIGITSRDLAAAGYIFIKSLGATSCLYFLSLTTPMVDVNWVLRMLKAPALLIELMNLTYRFIFVLAETSSQIYTAQSSRLGYMNCRNSYFSFASLVSNLLARSYRRSQAVLTAMSSRGYTGEIRVLQPSHKISRKNIMLITITGLLLSALSLGSAGGFAEWSRGLWGL